MMKIYQQILPSPVGELFLYANEHALLGVLWSCEYRKWINSAIIVPEDTKILQQVKIQLNQYFFQQRKSFDLPIQWLGTDFQQRVWNALLLVPYGHTLSYLSLAKQLAKPTAVRAVARAVGQNPLSIIAPCHRIIGSNGQLTGFAGGLANKQYLLSLEQQG